jgi:hypothetical protein
MTRYIGNSFSVQMVPDGGTIEVKRLGWDLEFFRGRSADFQSIVGHEDMANMLGVRVNRQSICLRPEDTLYVAQVSGGRLPPGTTELPEGIRIVFYRVQIEAPIRDWEHPVGGPQSVHGALLEKGIDTAAQFGGMAFPKERAGSFFVIIEANGFYGELWDE